MNGPVQGLISDLRRRGVGLQIAGDRLVVESPKGTVSGLERDALAASKSPVLEQLRLESQLEEMTLEEFEQQNIALELRVPWLDETLWFVPRAELVAELCEHSVARGRVYTARELTNLTTLVEASPEAVLDLQTVACLKARLGAEIVSVECDDEPVDQPGDPSPRPCHACHEHHFWRSIRGVTVCARCHPPAHERLVATWIDPGSGAS